MKRARYDEQPYDPFEEDEEELAENDPDYEEDYDDADWDEPDDEPQPPPRKPHKKKKKPSAAAQVALTVCMGLGLFAAVSGITWIALSLREGKKKQNSEEDLLPGIAEVRTSTTTATELTTTTLPTDLTDTSTSDTELTTTVSTTTLTEATTTVSTRIIPGEEEFPYFTRSYTYPDEASQDETTTAAAPSDPVKARYAAYGGALKKFLREKTNADNAPMYALTDLDGDGEPELIISGGTEADSRSKVLYYNSGTLYDLKGSSGGALGTLYLSGSGSDLLLIEMTESGSESSAVSYQLIGGRLVPQHTYHAANGSYTIDGTTVMEFSYNRALNRDAMKPAGRDTALPDDPEALTAVGDHAL
ncbi:MAG: hypothetical protein IJ060_03350 [Oscillospiraceae bacterium]|nr:hypothetical protein [Oscillospiraceae bacterium]